MCQPQKAIREWLVAPKRLYRILLGGRLPPLLFIPLPCVLFACFTLGFEGFFFFGGGGFRESSSIITLWLEVAVIPLLQPLKCQDYKCEPPHLAHPLPEKELLNCVMTHLFTVPKGHYFLSLLWRHWTHLLLQVCSLSSSAVACTWDPQTQTQVLLRNAEQLFIHSRYVPSTYISLK